MFHESTHLGTLHTTHTLHTHTCTSHNPTHNTHLKLAPTHKGVGGGGGGGEGVSRESSPESWHSLTPHEEGEETEGVPIQQVKEAAGKEG